MTLYIEDWIRVKNYFSGYNNSAYDPISSSIVLYDENGTEVSSWEDPTKEREGVWYKDIPLTSGLTSDSGPGIWKVKWKAWANPSEGDTEIKSINVESLLEDIEA